jgi:formylglycine-generating enzyme required for sulfatase activity
LFSSGSNLIAQKHWTNMLGMDFVYIPSAKTTKDQEKNTNNQKGFWLATYETTQKIWNKVMGNNPSIQKGENQPVENISWDDIQKFIAKMNQLQKGVVYRLPSELEWEYASQISLPDLYESQILNSYAWNRLNSGKKHHEAGLLKPNRFGIYDTFGNVMEWCQDSYIPSGKELRLPNYGELRKWKIYKGGHFHSDILLCSTESQIAFWPSYKSLFLGFRLICERGIKDDAIEK